MKRSKGKHKKSSGAVRERRVKGSKTASSTEAFNLTGGGAGGGFIGFSAFDDIYDDQVDTSNDAQRNTNNISKQKNANLSSKTHESISKQIKSYGRSEKSMYLASLYLGQQEAFQYYFKMLRKQSTTTKLKALADLSLLLTALLHRQQQQQQQQDSGTKTKATDNKALAVHFPQLTELPPIPKPVDVEIALPHLCYSFIQLTLSNEPRIREQGCHLLKNALHVIKIRAEKKSQRKNGYDKPANPSSYQDLRNDFFSLALNLVFPQLLRLSHDPRRGVSNTAQNTLQEILPREKTKRSAFYDTFWENILDILLQSATTGRETQLIASASSEDHNLSMSTMSPKALSSVSQKKKKKKKKKNNKKNAQNHNILDGRDDSQEDERIRRERLMVTSLHAISTLFTIIVRQSFSVDSDMPNNHATSNNQATSNNHATLGHAEVLTTKILDYPGFLSLLLALNTDSQTQSESSAIVSSKLQPSSVKLQSAILKLLIDVIRTSLSTSTSADVVSDNNLSSNHPMDNSSASDHGAVAIPSYMDNYIRFAIRFPKDIHEDTSDIIRRYRLRLLSTLLECYPKRMLECISNDNSILTKEAGSVVSAKSKVKIWLEQVLLASNLRCNEKYVYTFFQACHKSNLTDTFFEFVTQRFTSFQHVNEPWFHLTCRCMKVQTISNKLRLNVLHSSLIQFYLSSQHTSEKIEENEQERVDKRTGSKLAKSLVGIFAVFPQLSVMASLNDVAPPLDGGIPSVTMTSLHSLLDAFVRCQQRNSQNQDQVLELAFGILNIFSFSENVAEKRGILSGKQQLTSSYSSVAFAFNVIIHIINGTGMTMPISLRSKDKLLVLTKELRNKIMEITSQSKPLLEQKSKSTIAVLAIVLRYLVLENAVRRNNTDTNTKTVVAHDNDTMDQLELIFASISSNFSGCLTSVQEVCTMYSKVGDKIITTTDLANRKRRQRKFKLKLPLSICKLLIYRYINGKSAKIFMNSELVASEQPTRFCCDCLFFPKSLLDPLHVEDIVDIAK
eukprot:g3893.t1